MAINTEPSFTLDAELSQQIRLQRSLPDGPLREPIEASWQRSLAAGLDWQAGLELDRPSPGDVQQLKARNQQLLDCAAPEIELLTRQYAPEQALVMLADADAHLLAVQGDHRVVERAARYALDLGVCWSEGQRGTNALGTALVDGCAVKIEGGEHFMNSLTRFSCTSAPILAPDGVAVGVLDLTSQQGRVQQPLEVVQMAALNIENRLFSASFAEHWVIALHSRPQYLHSVWQGMLALEPDGTVRGANRQAHQLLNSREGSLLGQPLARLLAIQPGQLFDQLREGRTATLQTRRGPLYCQLLQQPAAVLAAARPRTAPPEKTPEPATRPDLAAVAGGDSRLARALAMAVKGVTHDLPILLCGETGTGKEVVARALHDASPRQHKPFVAVNCAAIPDGLIESELFGYREGAFTGSRKGGMVGRFQQAEGGTLFLDEIGDMPLSLQARLLRVLQERRVAPLGGGDEVMLDIRLICATHRDLHGLVQQGQFREDLFYRLNGVAVGLPALRQRNDLAMLMQRLLQQLQQQGLSRQCAGINSVLQQRLINYHWPGNIRQLETVLKAALVFMEPAEREILPHHLTDDFLAQLSHAEQSEVQSGSLRADELQRIQATLARHDGNISAAARSLGISRATLYRRLQQLDA